MLSFMLTHCGVCKKNNCLCVCMWPKMTSHIFHYDNARQFSKSNSFSAYIRSLLELSSKAWREFLNKFIMYTYVVFDKFLYTYVFTVVCGLLFLYICIFAHQFWAKQTNKKSWCRSCCIRDSLLLCAFENNNKSAKEP